MTVCEIRISLGDRMSGYDYQAAQ